MITETCYRPGYYNFTITLKEGKSSWYIWYDGKLFFHCTAGGVLARDVTTLTQARQGILRDLQQQHWKAHIALTDLQDTINTLKEMTGV